MVKASKIRLFALLLAFMLTAGLWAFIPRKAVPAVIAAAPGGDIALVVDSPAKYCVSSPASDHNAAAYYRQQFVDNAGGAWSAYLEIVTNGNTVYALSFLVSPFVYSSVIVEQYENAGLYYWFFFFDLQNTVFEFSLSEPGLSDIRASGVKETRIFYEYSGNRYYYMCYKFPFWVFVDYDLGFNVFPALLPPPEIPEHYDFVAWCAPR